MISYPSRAERRQVKLYSAAEDGKLSIELILYPREITKLETQGFTVSNVKPYLHTKDLFICTVDWSNAFGISIPHIVHSYITGIIKTSPQNYINNFAKELYIIAKKS